MHGMGESAVTPAFITKLWALVEDPSTDHLISWDTGGRSFHVYDQLQFAREVLPLYFKHGNIASFIRQLNMYGFRKVAQLEHGSLKTERDDMEFQHPYFIRGHEELVSQIKRKPPAAGVKEGESRVHKEDVTKVLTEMQTLKGKQDNMNGKLESMKRENEALWREVASLRQKHTQQQQIVNKLIQFLVTMVQKKPGMGVSRRRPLMINDSTEREGARPAKLARQYSLESVGGTHYTVDMPETPDTPLTAGLGRTGGVQIREVHDSIPSPGDLSCPTEISDGAVFNNEVLEPLVTDNLLDVTTTEEAPPTLDAYLQSRGQAAEPTTQLKSKPAKISVPIAQSVQVPSNYISVITTANPQGDAKPVKVDLRSGQLAKKANLTLNTGGTSLVTSSGGSVASQEPLTSLAVITDSSPSSSLNLSTAGDSRLAGSGPLQAVRALPSPKRLEVNEHLETIDADLEALKDLLASGTYSLDANTLLGLFNPEGPVPQTPEHLLNIDGHPLSTATDTQNEESTNNIVGNEVVQYVNPTADIGDIFEFDPTSAGVELGQDQPIFPELESELNTPQLFPYSPNPPSYGSIKQEGREMEEVD